MEFYCMAKKILLVDDDKDWRLLVDSSLRESGYEVITATDVTEAMAHMDQDQLDLLILDLDLAGENGLLLMEFLNVNRPALPIIVYSSFPEDDEASSNLTNERAQLYLQKGSMKELVEAIESILRGG